MTVTLATHCHARDLPRLHAPGVLEELINCHGYPFDEILVVHQRCGDLPYRIPAGARVIDIREEDYPAILRGFGLNPDDTLLNEVTHGWGWQWFWQHHCVNHLTEIMAARSDYIVFNDADCRIQNQPDSWISRGIELLENYPEILVVAPSDGGHEFNKMLPDGTRLTLTSSQQLFMGRASTLRGMDFTNLQWDGKYDAPYGPMQEFYGMFESWLWRWMRAHGLYRAVLPEQWRYWHGAYH